MSDTNDLPIELNDSPPIPALSKDDLRKQKRAEAARLRYQQNAEYRERKKEQAKTASAERYANMTHEEREAKRKRDRIPTPSNDSSQKPSTLTLAQKYDQRVLRMIERKKAWREKRYKELMAMQGGCPPRIKRRLESMRALLEVLPPDRKCQICGTTPIILPFWRVSRRDDPIDYVYFSARNLKRIKGKEHQYLFHCGGCAFNLRLLVWEWIFSPFSPRNNPEASNQLRDGKPLGSVGPYNDKVLEAIYPPGHKPLCERIKTGLIRSLRCTIRGQYGEEIESFVKVDPFKWYVGMNPGDCAWQEIGL